MKKQLSLLDENKSDKFENKSDKFENKSDKFENKSDKFQNKSDKFEPKDKKLEFQRRTKDLEDLEYTSSTSSSSEEKFPQKSFENSSNKFSKTNDPETPLRRFGNFEDLRDPEIDDVIVRNQNRKREPELNLNFGVRSKDRKPSTTVPNNTPTSPGYRSALVEDSGLFSISNGRSDIADETRSPTKTFKSILKNPQSSTESTESLRNQMRPVPENDLRSSSSFQKKNNDGQLKDSFDLREIRNDVKPSKTLSHDADEADIGLPRVRPHTLVLKKKSREIRNRESDRSSSESDRDTISNNLVARAEFRPPSALQMRRMESYDAAVSAKTDPNPER